MLANLLSLEHYAAVGLLELLWHFTAEYAPAGDIGRHEDQAIAKALHWRKKPIALIAALVGARWLDVSEPCRLVVHDWKDHADDATNSKLARARLFFFDGSAPSFKRLPPTERASAELFYATSVRTESAFQALSGEGMALAKAVGSSSEGSAEGYHAAMVHTALADAFNELAELWQKPCECCEMRFAWKDEMLGAQIWISLIHKGTITEAILPEIMAGLARYRASKDWHKDGGKYVPSVATWLGSPREGRPSAPKWRDVPAPKGAYD